LRRFLVIILLCVFNFNLFSKDTIRTKVDKNFYKFLAAEGVVLSGAILYLKHEWYHDKKRVPFHFYNDFKGWNQVDKLGHFYVSYLESNVGYSILKKFNFSEKKALYFGGFQGLILETPIEFFDAYHQGWGFSVSDLVANTLGSVFFIMQQKIFNEQIIKPKLSFSKSIYASEANGLLGKKSLISQFVYDYNGYTYWFSFSPKKIFKFKKVPKWLNLAIGYGANGMLGEFENKSMYKGEEIPSFKRYRQFYLSLDIDFSKIRTKSRFVNKIFDGLSYIKIPLPTLELSNKKMKGYFFYF
jgi:YHS domain-containing protein/VanZ family protein